MFEKWQADVQFELSQNEETNGARSRTMFNNSELSSAAEDLVNENRRPLTSKRPSHRETFEAGLVPSQTSLNYSADGESETMPPQPRILHRTPIVLSQRALILSSQTQVDSILESSETVTEHKFEEEEKMEETQESQERSRRTTGFQSLFRKSTGKNSPPLTTPPTANATTASTHSLLIPAFKEASLLSI